MTTEKQAVKKTNRFVLNAFVKTTSPLHIASPENKRWSLEENREVYGSTQGTAMIGVQKMRMADVIRYDVKDDQGNIVSRTRQIELPVVPANNLNGGLRRIAAKIILEALMEKNERINIETYSGMTCGAVTGKPEGSTILFDEYRKARNHVFVGIFGGGPRMLRRNVRVHNMLPFTDYTKQNLYRDGVMHHPELDGVQDLGLAVTVPSGVDMNQTIVFNRKDDLEMLSDVELQNGAIEDYSEKIKTRQEAILDEKTKEKSKENSKTSTRTFSALQFVIPGINFPFNLEMELNDAQMGLYLLAIEKFVQDGRIGGWLRNGFGCFSLDYACLSAGDSVIVKDVFNGRTLNRSDKQIKKFLDAYEAELTELSAEALNYLYRLPAVKLTKAQKDAAKAAKAK